MKISVALNRLKTLKSKISQTETYIGSCVTMYEDESPEFEYLNELKVRQGLVDEILKLKTSIQVTNSQTKVNFNGKRMTMTEVILLNAQVRSEMKFVMDQIAQNLDVSRFDARSKDDIKKVYAGGYDKATWRKRLAELESTKEELDILMANTNARTDLIDS